MSKAIDKVRTAEARQMKEDGYEPLLTGSRWLLLKRPENLSEKPPSITTLAPYLNQFLPTNSSDEAQKVA